MDFGSIQNENELNDAGINEAIVHEVNNLPSVFEMHFAFIQNEKELNDAGINEAVGNESFVHEVNSLPPVFQMDFGFIQNDNEQNDAGINEAVVNQAIVNEVNNLPRDFNGVDENENGENGENAESTTQPVEVKAPAIGMVFDSVDEALDFYIHYGKLTGFGAVKRTSHKKDKIVYQYKFCCGKYKDPETHSPPVKRRRPFVGTKCQAFMNIADHDFSSKWIVQSVNLEHNHEPNASFLIPTHRFIPERYQKLIEYNEDISMEPCKNIEAVIEGAGGYGKATFTRKDARNHLDKYRKEKLRRLGGDDIVLLFEYFEKKKQVDPDFHYTYNYTDTNRLYNIFWANGRGRALYKYFHDVLVLDATYLTNRYDMPLVLFVGVNHHGQSVIFACALLAKEGEAEYIWCLERFLDCMSGIKPDAILTDQCASIEAGIREVFGAATIHRYCSWHILHKLASKWGNVPNKDALSDMVKSVVYGSITEIEFEDRWDKLMRDLGKADNEWFCGLFKMREKWVPAYLKAHFWAGMTTTQRAESMNHIMKEWLKKRTSLYEFALQFDKGLGRNWENEHLADHDSRYRSPVLWSALPMERQFRDHYTKAIFYKCQEEIKDTVNFSCRYLHDRDGFSVYVVTDCRNSRSFDVVFHREFKEVLCVCQMFFTNGILCSHSIVVLKNESIFFVDRKYLLDRWRKDIIRPDLMLKGSSCSNPDEHNRYYELNRAINPIVNDLLNYGCVSDNHRMDVFDGLQELRRKLIVINTPDQQNYESSNNSFVRGSPCSTGNVIGINVPDTIEEVNAEKAAEVENTVLSDNEIASNVSLPLGEVEIGRGRGRSLPTIEELNTATFEENERAGNSLGEEIAVEGPIGRGRGRGRGRGQIIGVIGETVNSPPPNGLQPPVKSKRRGRPKKITNKHPIDIAVAK